MSHQTYSKLYFLLYKQQLYQPALFIRYMADRLYPSHPPWGCGHNYLKELCRSYRKTNIDWYINI